MSNRALAIPAIVLCLLRPVTAHGAGVDHDAQLDPTNEEVWRAIGLSFGAGISTGFGALLALCVKEEHVRGKSKFLASTLAFAAAVMIYVSLVELWPTANEHFEKHLHEKQVENDEQLAHVWTSVTFFGGIMIGVLIHAAVDCFDSICGLGHSHSHDPLGPHGTDTIGVLAPTSQGPEEGPEGDVELTEKPRDRKDSVVVLEKGDTTERQPGSVSEGLGSADVFKAGLVTAFSLAMHNFPEGIVTFIAALQSWKIGLATAVAIAIHNIPEGISVAIPIYYSTKSRWKAITMAVVSGLFEPLGALVGWAIMQNLWGRAAFGAMFGIVTGIMTYISFMELLPLAWAHDPRNKLVPWFVFLGFLVMDISLVVAH